MGLISEESIQRVAEANDIVEVIGSYFPLKRAGTSFRALCPFHREKSPSFHVNPTRQNFHCFGCGAGGGVLRFVMDYEHVDFPTAVKRLAQRAGIPIIEEAGNADDDRKRGLRQRLLGLHAEAADWFHRNLLKSPDASPARDYLKARGITGDIARSWQLGYAPDSWDALLDFLRDRKFNIEEISQSGLASSKDDGGDLYSRFRGRVMFPIRNDYGEVVAFSGRVLDPEAKTAKYVNSPETPLFTKGKVLYGLDKTKRDLIEKNAAIVCEGQLDLISAFEAGVRHVIAPQGTAFTSDQARLLRRFVETVLLCFDSDTAGQQAAARSLPALLSQGLAVRVVELPAGEDPDSLIRKSGPGAFLEVVARAKDFFDHATDKAEASGELADPAGKSRLVHRLGPPLALVQDATLRESHLGRIASRLGIPQQAIRSTMKPPTATAESQDEKPAPALETVSLSPGISILCRLAMTSRPVREWLREQGSAAPFDANGGLLDKIARAEFDENDPSTVAVFVSSLGVAAERALAGLDLSRTVPDPLSRAGETWSGLVAQQLAKEIEGLKNLLARPGISPDERIKIQKQILDLKIRVADGFRPSQ
ncbi:MAG: DNA primase [Verrucomicrobiaceae bacterium]|nr:MAG: DNA primase [Verrucomicrobiaceae bacterium]